MKTADRAASLTRQLLAFSRMQVLQPRILDLNTLVADMSKLLRRLVREDIEFSFRLGDSLGRVKADPGQLEQVLLNLTVNASDAMPQGGKLTIETKELRWMTSMRMRGRRSGRELCAAGGHGHRSWNGRRHEVANLRAVFHDQGARQRNWAGPGDGIWRGEAERRLYLGGIFAGEWSAV